MLLISSSLWTSSGTFMAATLPVTPTRTQAESLRLSLELSAMVGLEGGESRKVKGHLSTMATPQEATGAAEGGVGENLSATQVSQREYWTL